MNSIQALAQIMSVIDGPEAEYIRGWGHRDQLEFAEDFIMSDDFCDVDEAIKTLQAEVRAQQD